MVVSATATAHAAVWHGAGAQLGVVQVDTIYVGAFQICARHHGTGQIGVLKIRATHIAPCQVCLGQVAVFAGSGGVDIVELAFVAGETGDGRQ